MKNVSCRKYITYRTCPDSRDRRVLGQCVSSGLTRSDGRSLNVWNRGTYKVNTGLCDKMSHRSAPALGQIWRTCPQPMYLGLLSYDMLKQTFSVSRSRLSTPRRDVHCDYGPPFARNQ